MNAFRAVTATAVLAAATAAGATVPTVSAEAAPVRVSVHAPQYDSPGALVPAIVTVYSPPAGYLVSLSMKTSNGATSRCVGRTWRNPGARTVSRKCYVSLPFRAGSHTLTGSAELTRKGSPRIVRTGRASRPLLANGYHTRRMTLVRAQQVERCFNPTDKVWLTFDDNATAAGLKRILSTLRRNNVRGRFFFTGIWARGNPSLLRLIGKEGHLLANHTSTHRPLSRSSGSQVESELRNGVRATTAPKLLRPPFAAGALTGRLDTLAGEQGYRLCRWTTDTYDWEGPSATTMAGRVRYGDYRTPPVEAGGVVLMHGKGRHTATGLQRIIDAVRARGLALDPLRR